MNQTTTIKQQTNITQVIGKYIRLEKKGVRHIGLCPFHDDHNPSLTVDSNKQTFVCYACGEKGDVISFIQKIEKCDFKKAVEKLKAPPPPEGGIKNNNPSFPRKREPQKNQPDKNRSFSEFLSQLMPPVTGDSSLTPTYLDFQVGIAPHLLSGKSNQWKMMAGRMIFPIHDENGTLLGMAGRLITPPLGGRGVGGVGVAPKYLNTPGLPRSQTLYGLHRAKEAIRQTGTAYLVEGFKDVIAMHAAGITGTVGLCGTQMADGQKELLLRHARQVILVMDGDPAGRQAARTITATLRQAGLRAAPIHLPDGTDPDSLFREQGKEAFAGYIHAQAPFTDPMEVRLVTALTLYPHTRIHFRDEWHPFPVILARILAEEDLPFQRESHRQLLAQYADGAPPGAPLPDAQEAAAIQRMQQEILTDKQCTSEEATAHLLRHLLYIYCETRLIDLIKTLCCRLAGDPSSEAHRMLARRHLQLTTISGIIPTAHFVR